MRKTELLTSKVTEGSGEMVPILCTYKLRSKKKGEAKSVLKSVLMMR